MEEKEEKILTKKELKQKILSQKLEEKQRKFQEKAEIKAEKERRKNSFGRKVRNFFLTIIFVIILLLVGFYFGKQFLTNKEKELSNQKMEQIYQQALSFLENKDYESAIELLQSITQDFSNYSEVAKKLKEVEQLYLNDYLVSADEYLKNKNYDKALEVISKIQSSLQKVDSVISKKSEIHIAKLKDEISKIEGNEKNKDILVYLENYNTEGLTELEDQIDELREQYKNEFILEARELLNKNFGAAKKQIDEVAKLLPDDKDIKELVNEVSKVKTVNLLSLEEISRTRLYSSENSSIKDVDGNQYNGYIKSFMTGNTGTVNYVLDKKYSSFYGKICIAEDQEKGTIVGEPKVNIYNGEQLIYSSNVLNYDTKCIDFAVDVSDVDELKIEIVTNNTLDIFIAEPTLIEK